MKFFSLLSFYISQIGSFWQEKVNSQIFRWNIFFIVVQIALIFFRYTDLPPQVPLYYSQPWGEAQLATVSYLFLLPIASFIVLVLNNFLAIFYLKSLQLLSRLLVVTSLVFSIFATLSILQIIRLVT